MAGEALTDLRQLNAASARIAEFAVKVCYPKVIQYQFVQNGQQKLAQYFSCRLTSGTEHDYCEGCVRGSKEQVQSAAESFKYGMIFKMKKVVLSQKVPTTYISADLKVVVDMQKTSFDAACKTSNLAETCVSKRTVKDVLEITSQMSFDLTAFVRSASDPKSVQLKSGQAAEVVEVTVADGSRNEEGSLLCLTISIWAKALAAEIKAQENSIVSFMGLMAVPAPDRGAVRVKNGDATFIIAASDGLQKSSRVQRLQTEMAATLATDAQLESIGEFVPKQLPFDVAAEPALLTTCHLLESMADDLKLGAGTAQLFQLNGVHLQVPTDDNVLTKDGKRIWFTARAFDYSGTTIVGVSQEAALELSGCADKDAFLQQVASNQVQFPVLSTVRVVRSIRDLKSTSTARPAASQEVVAASESADKVVNAVVMKAAHYSIEQLPSKAVHDLTDLLSCTSAATDGLLPCQLQHVSLSSHYGFQIAYGEQKRTCTRALALLKSTEKSVTAAVGSGFRVTTKNVQDAGDAANTSVYTVSGYCLLDNVTEYKLDPAKGGRNPHRLVLAVVTGKIDDEFVVEQLWHLDPSQEATALEHFAALLAAAARVQGGMLSGAMKRKVEWTKSTPLDTRKCRSLARYPTDIHV